MRRLALQSKLLWLQPRRLIIDPGLGPFSDDATRLLISWGDSISTPISLCNSTRSANH